MSKTKNSYVLVMILYLAGIFMGAIDTGIVTPARTIIQNQMGVDPQSGIWMITIYTLAYAASVPIMGKLADKYGRKYIYIFCITFFGTGSLLCGLSSSIGGFPMLIGARVIQAIGGGGIVPIATAEFGTTFPEEKRGLALGLVGGVYGIANVFGASAGSAIMDFFGVENWKFIFYINVPISIFIVACGLFVLKNNRDEENDLPIDLFGITTLTIMVLSLLYGIKNLDFFDFRNSITDTNVYAFLLIFAVLIPVFIFAEKRAADPVISLRYFTDRNILVTLMMSTLSGFVMMGVIFVPQFSENCLKLATGSGGYLVIFLGLFAGFGAPISGKLIDKWGAKPILAFGFLATGIGALFMMFVTTKHPSLITVLIGLAFAGLGMGFTMGTPVNYMMLENTDPKQSNSALATLSLVRSVGTAIAPAIMVGFIANAGMGVQGDIMDLLPKDISMPTLPYEQQIEEKMDELKADENFADKMGDMPSFSEMKSMELDFDADDTDFELPDDTLEMLQSSDVTTIVDNTKTMAAVMFDEFTPDVIAEITDGINEGLDGIDTGIAEMENARSEMQSAISQMKTAKQKMDAAKRKMASTIDMLEGKMDSMQNKGGKPGGSDPSGDPADQGGQEDQGPQMPDQDDGGGTDDGLTPDDTTDDPGDDTGETPGGDDQQGQGQMPPGGGGKGMPPGKGGMPDIEAMKKAMNSMKDLGPAIAKMQNGVRELGDSIEEMKTLSAQMTEMRDAVPGAFDTALKDYQDAIEKKRDVIEATFQAVLNRGFSQIYLLTAITSALALILLAFYRKKEQPGEGAAEAETE